jgi:hypothetical protein
MKLNTFLEHVFESPIAVASYGIMALVLIEAIFLVVFAERETGRAIQLQRWLLKISNSPSRQGIHGHERQIRAFVSERLVPLRHRLANFETAGGYLSLLFTMLSYAIAIPGATKALENDPEALFIMLGLGSGVSCMGIATALLAHVSGKRLDSVIDRIEATVNLSIDCHDEVEISAASGPEVVPST